MPTSPRELYDLLGISQEEADEGVEIESEAGEEEPKGKKAEGKKEPKEIIPAFRSNQIGPNVCTDPVPSAFIAPKEFLKPDVQDEYIPANSFISDFVYMLKGYESPVLFNIWGAIFAISVAGARKSWFKFGADRIFPNMYILWVAKPGVCKKGTALGYATKLLQELPNQFPDDPYMREERNIDYISGKAPADAIFMSLKPKVRTFILPDGSAHMENFGSRTYVSASELATFLNTKKFNTGLVDALTDLFDCKDADRELTRTRGIENYKDFYFCLGGCCTPMHMETSFPPEARGGGFMSRCIMVHQEFPTVWHEIPEVYEGFPTMTDLLPKLRWITYKSRGEYYFTPEARAEYKRWYMAWRAALFERGIQDDALAETRMDILTIKLATILRMAEYREGFDITLDNYKQARHLLSYTLSHSSGVASGLGAKEKRISYTRVRAYMQTHKSLSRRKLLPAMSAKSIFVSELNNVLCQLVQEGFLSIEIDGYKRPVPGAEGREVYTWIGPSSDEELKKAQDDVEASEVPHAESP